MNIDLINLAGYQPLDATLTSLAAVSGVQGDLLYASGTDAWTRLAKSATATHALLNTGASNNPAWGQVPLASGVSGTLPVANGGTGLTTGTTYYVPFFTSTGVIGTTSTFRYDTAAGQVYANRYALDGNAGSALDKSTNLLLIASSTYTSASIGTASGGQEWMKLASTGVGMIVNEVGADVDCRFESDTDTTCLTIDAGNNSVGIGVALGSHAASSKFQVDSTTDGFLPPRMTTTQRDAISAPAAGLTIYNTTTNKLNVYTTAWEAVTSV